MLNGLGNPIRLRRQDIHGWDDLQISLFRLTFYQGLLLGSGLVQDTNFDLSNTTFSYPGVLCLELLLCNVKIRC